MNVLLNKLYYTILLNRVFCEYEAFESLSDWVWGYNEDQWRICFHFWNKNRFCVTSKASCFPACLTYLGNTRKFPFSNDPGRNAIRPKVAVLAAYRHDVCESPASNNHQPVTNIQSEAAQTDSRTYDTCSRQSLKSDQIPQPKCSRFIWNLLYFITRW